MALKTLQAQLEEVQTAISRLVAGYESYTVDGVTYKRTNLDMLERREQRLLRQLRPRVSYAQFNQEN